MLTKLLLKSIFLYQKYVSPFLRSSCMFYPTCSEYMKISIIKHGPFLGSYKGILRIIHCNPLFSKPHIDHP